MTLLPQSPHFRRWFTRRAVATLIIAIAGITTYVVNFPGSLEDDSFEQLLEGRTGIYSFWHPPIMSWMLGVSDAIGPAAAWFVLFDMVLAFGALSSLLWLVRRVSWAAVACAVVIVLLPQMALLQAVVWKDALFADAALAGFVCLAHAANRWQNRRLRYALLGAAAVCLALAALARQNGVVMLFCASPGLGTIAALREKRWRIGAAYGAGLLCLSGLLALAANEALAFRSDGTPALEDQFKVLELYDITGMVKYEPSLPLDVLDRKSPPLAALIRSDGIRLWSPVKNDTLEYSPRLTEALDDVPPDVLSRQWRALVLDHTWAYLAVRAKLFAWVFLPDRTMICHPFHVGDEGNPADLRALGMRSRMDNRDLMLWRYGDVFRGTPAFSHPFFAVIAALALIVLLHRRRPADLAMASLMAAALAFTASFFVISIACDYRYLMVLDLAAIAGALYLSADPHLKRGPEGPL
jgi:hypothetical protein